MSVLEVHFALLFAGGPCFFCGCRSSWWGYLALAPLIVVCVGFASVCPSGCLFGVLLVSPGSWLWVWLYFLCGLARGLRVELDNMFISNNRPSFHLW